MASRLALILAAGALLIGCRFDLDTVPDPGGDGDGDGDGDGPDAGPGGPEFLVAGASPSMVGPGDTVVIEGRFPDPTQVFLPGADGPVPATVDVLGSRRLAITVPDGALSGALELRGDGMTISGPELRIASYAPRMGDLAIHARQFTTARQTAVLDSERRGAAVIAVGDWLYVLGGVTGGAGWRDDIERARINADGTLGGFAAAGQLRGPRAFAAVVRIHDQVYLVGGSDGSPLASIERAAVDGGELGPFADAGTISAPRSAHRAVIVGDALYLLGGRDQTGNVAMIERATVDADGNLSSFTVVDGVELGTARSGFTEVLTRSELLVAGGSTGTVPALDMVEGAAASGEGALADFAVADAVDLKPRTGHAGFSAGQRAYVLGGTDTDPVEAATIAADGLVDDFTRDTATLRVERSDAGLALARDHVYLAGGSAVGDLDSVEEASLARDVELDTLAAAGALTTARSRAGWVVLGNRLCAIGGAGAAGSLASVECAPVAADGALGAFADAGVTLGTARAAAALAVIGSWLYVIGGENGSGPLRSLERAPIAADGTLGGFVAAGNLITRRAGAVALVLGDTLHVLSGWDGTELDDRYESAAIAADGDLGVFTVSEDQVPKLRGGIAGVVGPYVEVIGLDKNKRATISGDGFGSFGDDDGSPLRGEVSGTVAGDWLFVTGGVEKPQNLYATRMSQAGVSPMSTAGTLVTPRLASGAVVLGDWLYILGGETPGGQPLASIERARLR